MDKGQALQAFWGGFGLSAYENTTVPKDAEMPYITYEVVTDSDGNTVSMSGDLWYYGESWMPVDRMTDVISKFIGYGGIVLKMDDGYVWIKKGTPFAQHVADPNDMVRRVRLGVEVDFLTE